VRGWLGGCSLLRSEGAVRKRRRRRRRVEVGGGCFGVVDRI
jgi:hypothetical protein